MDLSSSSNKVFSILRCELRLDSSFSRSRVIESIRRSRLIFMLENICSCLGLGDWSKFLKDWTRRWFSKLDWRIRGALFVIGDFGSD